MPPEKDNLVSIKRLSDQTEYYTNVFKKTEKVLSALVYILSQITTQKDSEFYITILRDRVFQTHTVLLQSLRATAPEVTTQVRALQYALVDLESTLTIAEAGSVVPSNLAQLLYEQLLTVQRYIAHHYVRETPLSLESSQGAVSFLSQGQSAVSAKRPSTNPKNTRRKHVAIPQGDISSDAYFVYSSLTDRAERIKTVLEAKPQATIKDIAEIITDVSEKTIQRELNSLIEKGQVIREGERRWSRYSVSK